MTKKYKVRDLRIKEKYFLDDNYLNGYARVCGVYGTAVYNSLSRHADKNQYCFPNIDLMAKQHGCSKPSIIKGIKKLEEYNIIYVHRERTKSGTWKNNGYDLLDKSLWKDNQVNDIELGTKSTSFTPPSKRGLPDQVNEIDYKETHSKDTHNKDKATKVASKDINEVIEAFNSVNPSYKRLFKNTTERKASGRLILEHGKDRIVRSIKVLPQIISKPYAPKPITPYQFESDLGKIKAFISQSKGVKNKSRFIQ